MKGRLIAVEGIDGSGKTALVSALLEHPLLLSQERSPILCKVPSDKNPVSREIRAMLMDKGCRSEMRPDVLDLLYLAAQVQEGTAVAWPAISQGINVVADRWLISQMAYSCTRCVDERVLRLYEDLFFDICPVADVTILLTCDPWIAARRAGDRKEDQKEADRQSAKEYGRSPILLAKIQSEYRKICARYISGDQGPERKLDIRIIDTTYKTEAEVVEEAVGYI